MSTCHVITSLWTNFVQTRCGIARERDHDSVVFPPGHMDFEDIHFQVWVVVIYGSQNDCRPLQHRLDWVEERDGKIPSPLLFPTHS